MTTPDPKHMADAAYACLTTATTVGTISAEDKTNLLLMAQVDALLAVYGRLDDLCNRLETLAGRYAL